MHCPSDVLLPGCEGYLGHFYTPCVPHSALQLSHLGTKKGDQRAKNIVSLLCPGTNESAKAHMLSAHLCGRFGPFGHLLCPVPQPFGRAKRASKKYARGTKAAANGPTSDLDGHQN